MLVKSSKIWPIKRNILNGKILNSTKLVIISGWSYYP